MLAWKIWSLYRLDCIIYNFMAEKARDISRSAKCLESRKHEIKVSLISEKVIWLTSMLILFSLYPSDAFYHLEKHSHETEFRASINVGLSF